MSLRVTDFAAVQRAALCAARVAMSAAVCSSERDIWGVSDPLCHPPVEVPRLKGRTVVEEFTDHAISGATLLRSGFQVLMRDALNKRFDIVLAEGDITHLHVGLKGTRNALFLKDLADKTRRGLRGRVELGTSGGGLCYGCKVTRSTPDGAALTGARGIVPAEAELIRRIFRDYAAGFSPKTIAKRLNAERCLGPGGSPWNPSTIHGSPGRRTGILNNELYVGRLVWNRLRYVKDPDTGTRVSRPNAPSSG